MFNHRSRPIAARGSSSRWSRTLRAAIAALSVLALPALATAPAGAATGDLTTAPTVRTQTGQSLSAGLDRALQQIDVAVPDGLRPTMLRATLRTSDPTLSGTTATVTVGDRVATVVALDGSRTVSIALRSSDVTDGRIPFGLVHRSADQPTGTCVRTDAAIATLADIVLVSTASASPPTTLAEFLSGTVTSAVVEVADPDHPLLREAGLNAVAALTHQFAAQSPDVALVTSTGSVTDNLERRVRLVAGTGEAITRIDADGSLTISGDPASLVAAAKALGSSVAVLDDSSDTSGLAAAVTATQRSSVLSLADLGAGTHPVTVTGASSVSFAVDQADFGGPVTGLVLHLAGTRSAVPATVHPIANVYLNDVLVDSFALGEGGAFTRTIPLMEGALGSRNTLRIELPVALDDGVCADVLDGDVIRLSVDTVSSTVTPTSGQGLASGFGRFPQTLSGGLGVAFDTALTGSDALEAAGDLVAALAVQQRAQLLVSEVGIDAADLVVGATEETARQLGSPLRLAAFRTVSGGLAVGVDAPFAALQAFEHDGRDVLLLGTHGDATSLARDLASTVRTQQYGWQALHGDLFVTTSATAPTWLDSRTLVPQAGQVDAYRPASIWLLVTAVAGLGLVAAGIVWRHVRRSAVDLRRVDGH